MADPVKAVGFDLDGTLIDSTEAIVAAFQLAFKELGETPPDAAAIEATIAVPLEAQLTSLVDGDVTQHAAAYRRHYARIAPNMTSLFPGVEEALHRVRDAGLPMGIATSKRREAAEDLLSHLEVRHLFACCIGPEEVSRPKPYPDAVLLLCENLGVRTGELVYIGDSPLDIEAAGRAGARSVGVLTGVGKSSALRELGCDCIVPDLGAAVEYILSKSCGNLLTGPHEPI